MLHSKNCQVVIYWLPRIFLQSKLRRYQEKLGKDIQSQVTRNFPGRTWLPLPLWPQVLALSSLVSGLWLGSASWSAGSYRTHAVLTLEHLLAKGSVQFSSISFWLRSMCMHLSLCFSFHTIRNIYILPLLRELLRLARFSKFHMTKTPDLVSPWLHSVQPAMRAAPS